MTADLEGRHVLVTGGSRGIGAEVARTLARAGAAVAVSGRDETAAASVRDELTGRGHLSLAFDVADEQAWTSAVAEIDAWGPLSGVVTAAATLTPVGPIGAYEPRDFLNTLRVNVFGTFLALHHAVPRLRRNGGHAVTFSGGGATSPQRRFDAYAASKAAVVRLTENLAEELREDGVRINAVAPGMVATGIHDTVLEAGPDAVGRDYFERTQRALAGDAVPASAAAELVAFLLSGASDGLTGRLVSAQWDDWRAHEYVEQMIAEPSLGTLRRVDGMFVMPAAESAG